MLVVMRWMFLAIAIFVLACSESVSSPVAGASGSVGPDGATLDLGDVHFVFPPEAVQEPVQVTINRIEAPDPRISQGDWFELHPAGLNLRHPAEVLMFDIDDTVDVVKRVEGSDGRGQPFHALQALRQSNLENGARSASIHGFSSVGRSSWLYGGGCRAPLDAPEIVSATYDPCEDLIEVSWRSDGPVAVQVGFREGRRAGEPLPEVTWQAITQHQQDGRMAFRPSVYPAPDELAYTFIIRAFHIDACNGQNLLSPPAAAEVPVIGLVAPRPPENVQAQRTNGGISLQWSLPTRTGGGVDFDSNQDGFEIRRQPPWPDGVRRTDGLVFQDSPVSPAQRYTYSVRAFWNLNACAMPLASEWTTATVEPEVTPDGERTCGAWRLSVTPTSQTMRPQTPACVADGSCPDAEMDVVIEHLTGAPLPDLVLLAAGYAAIELGRVTIESPFAAESVEGYGVARLTDGMASRYTATIRVVSPSLEPFEATWSLNVGTRECFVPTEVIVAP